MGKDELFDLTGRVAVVTGGAGLLGRRHVEILSAYGAKVALVDRTAEACTEAAQKLGAGVEGIACDVTRQDAVESLTKRILDRWGRVDILVNNAAAKSRNFFDPFETFPVADWEEVMATNVTGVFLCCRALGGWMAHRGAGSIINIASIYGVVGPDQRIYEGSEFEGRAINTPAVYSTSKGAVISLTRYLAAYWGARGVRVNTLTPGGVRSGQNDAFVRKYSERVPLGRMANADELQGAVLFLASESSRYVTGHNLVVDGGWTVW